MLYLNRHLQLPTEYNFFLFGARNTGKSTLLSKSFLSNNTYNIDLLDINIEEKYSRDPSILEAEVLGLESTTTHVVIDEVQKIPKLLDMVHKLIEQTDKKFVLTGSSARKLRHGGANLLAGRAFVYNLYPFTSFELGPKFILQEALSWGMLPSIYYMQSDDAKFKFLQAYTQTYLKEEVWMEQYIRKLNPFRKFLEVSAQCNGKLINYSNISRDVGVDDKTVKEYFTILEDTLIGFFLEPYQHSFRKRLSHKPKFYYFDTGVVRSLSRMLSVPLVESTSNYGDLFESFIINEIIKLANYFKPEYKFYYLQTKDELEVDLIVERPGQKHLFIEIKSSKNVNAQDIKNINKISNEFGDSYAICLSRDKEIKKIDNVTIYPWQHGIDKYFMKT